MQKPKMIKQLFSISGRNLEMINELQATGRCSTKSDVIRQALSFFYDQIMSNEPTKEKTK